MRPRHVAVAVVIAAIWGVNFVVIDVGLGSLPPLLFAGLRFVAAAFPAVLLVRRPAIPWRWFVLIGLPLGVGQFGLLFTGMHLGMPAGLSSLVLQSQALFTAVFAAFVLRERPRRTQVAGIALAFAGIAVIGLSLGQAGPLFAFLLCVAGAAMWGLANIGMRKAQPPDAFAFMVWLSLVPPLPLLALSLILEGPRADLHAVTHISVGGDDAFLYPMLQLGAAGGVVATAGVAPAALTALESAVRAGDTDAARSLHNGLLPLVRALFAEPSPSVIKAVLAELGLISHAFVRAPLRAPAPSSVGAAMDALTGLGA
jgi:drug/metabolite transporter (DMT)-like permease